MTVHSSGRTRRKNSGGAAPQERGGLTMTFRPGDHLWLMFPEDSGLAPVRVTLVAVDGKKVQLRTVADRDSVEIVRSTALLPSERERLTEETRKVAARNVQRSAIESMQQERRA